MIKLDHVSKTYENGKNAIKDISLTIEDGEFVFIIGDSGSGKTTLVRLLLREIAPTEGKIEVFGQDVGALKAREIPAYRRKMGVVFQDFRLLKDRDVYDNIALAQAVIGAPIGGRKKKISSALTLVGLSSKYRSNPRELSGGEQQRVAIARAIVNGPKLLVCDEPTGNMDPDNAWKIMQILERINQKGTTVIVVTHSKELVDRMQKRVVAMRHGRIVSDMQKGLYYEDK